MIAALTIILAQALISHDRWDAAVVTSTNVEGSVLRLEFADSKVIAGDRLFGRMVVSNASSENRWIHYTITGRRDSYIGDFLVTDEQGIVIPKTSWSSLEAVAMWSRDRGRLVEPSNSAGFDADLVRQYSLTNPGTYSVRAVAQVPWPGETFEEVVVETPPVEITVLPRPEGAPPPEPLYTAAELARIPKNEAPPQLQVTPRRSRTKPPPSNMQRQSGTGPPGGINSKLREPVPLTGAGANDPIAATPANSPPAGSRTRTVAYASIVLLGFAVLGTMLWRSRRSDSDAKKGE